MDEEDQTEQLGRCPQLCRQRNFLRDEMKVGDGVLYYYHSMSKFNAVVGTAVVVMDAYPDFTAWDPNSDHPDPKSTRETSGTWSV